MVSLLAHAAAYAACFKLFDVLVCLGLTLHATHRVSRTLTQIEIAVCEQFKTVYKNGKWVTEPLESMG